MEKVDIDIGKRIMALDLGERRIGVAVSDSLHLTAQGIEVIDRRKVSHWFDRLDQLVQEYEIGLIIIGLPRNMDGSLGESGKKSKQWAETIRERYHLPVYLWDERLSTMAAERTLITADVSRRKRKQVIDKIAASWILQGFLDAVRGIKNGTAK